MKKTRLSALALFVSLATTATCLAKEKSEDAEESENEVTIEKMILVRDTGKDFEPVKKFKPTDNFGVIVKLSEAKAGTKVKGVWSVVDAGEMQDKKLLTKEVEITSDIIKTVKESNRVNFTLTHDKPYPAGDYKFEAYLNGELADTLEFTIEE